MFQHIDPPIEVHDPDDTHTVLELFARDGEEVLVNRRGRNRGHGASRISLAEAQRLARQQHVKLTCGQSDMLRSEPENG
ncbi:MAG: hypothetical protein HZC02_02790 [Candidatus Levybacteria bacterium]|nr:hypothetical protein [Candidatus Levybacteria bacterium]